MMASPVLPSGVGLVSAPRMVGAVAGSAIGKAAGDWAGNKVGLSPNASQFAGDAIGIIGGGLGAGAGSMAETGAKGEAPLIRGVGRDLAKKYVGNTLADRILPEPEVPPTDEQTLAKAVREKKANYIPTKVKPTEVGPADAAQQRPGAIGPRQRAAGWVQAGTGPSNPEPTPAPDVSSQVEKAASDREVNMRMRRESQPVPEPVGSKIGYREPVKTKGVIVSPDSPPPHVEGSYWSFDRDTLGKAALKDRDAAIVYKQRFGNLPPGSKYVTDVGSKPNKGLYVGKQ